MKTTATTQSDAIPFKVKQTTSGHITAHQLGVVLGCIASDAVVLKDLLSRCADMAPDVDAVNSYCTAMDAIVQRMAWVADTACSGLPGTAGVSCGFASNLTELFLPPAFSCGVPV